VEDPAAGKWSNKWSNNPPQNADEDRDPLRLIFVRNKFSSKETHTSLNPARFMPVNQQLVCCTEASSTAIRVP
jgi:hypothetical protein